MATCMWATAASGKMAMGPGQLCHRFALLGWLWMSLSLGHSTNIINMYTILGAGNTAVPHGLRMRKRDGGSPPCPESPSGSCGWGGGGTAWREVTVKNVPSVWREDRGRGKPRKAGWADRSVLNTVCNPEWCSKNNEIVKLCGIWSVNICNIFYI